MASPEDNPLDIARVSSVLAGLSTSELLQVIGPAVSRLELPEVKQLIALTSTPASGYLSLGALIDDESPYFTVGQAIFTLTAPNISITGEFANRNPAAGNLYKRPPEDPIPLPTDSGSKTWYFHHDWRPGDIDPNNPPNGFCRIVKSIEIRYQPDVDTGLVDATTGNPVGAKPPHLIILYSGGDSGGGP
jgi:hypothetical protein